MCKKLAVVLEILLGCGVVLGWGKERGGGGGKMDGGEEGWRRRGIRGEEGFCFPALSRRHLTISGKLRLGFLVDFPGSSLLRQKKKFFDTSFFCTIKHWEVEIQNWISEAINHSHVTLSLVAAVRMLTSGQPFPGAMLFSLGFLGLCTSLSIELSGHFCTHLGGAV